MLILVGVLVISAAVVGYLIWSNGGFVKRPEHVMITHSVPGFTLRQADPTDIEVKIGLIRMMILGAQMNELEAWINTVATDADSQKTMERLGFSPEPEIEQYEAPNGEVFDMLWYKVGVGTRPPR